MDVLAGTPFMIGDDVSVCPAKRDILVQGSEVILYNLRSSAISHAHPVHHSHSYSLRSSSPSTIVFPGNFLEMAIQPLLSTLATQAHTDAPSIQLIY